MKKKYIYIFSQVLVDDITIKHEDFDKVVVGVKNADLDVSLNTPITIEDCSPGSSRNLQASFFI